jgi:hypothetical protein
VSAPSTLGFEFPVPTVRLGSPPLEIVGMGRAVRLESQRFRLRIWPNRLTP